MVISKRDFFSIAPAGLGVALTAGRAGATETGGWAEVLRQQAFHPHRQAKTTALFHVPPGGYPGRS